MTELSPVRISYQARKLAKKLSSPKVSTSGAGSVHGLDQLVILPSAQTGEEANAVDGYTCTKIEYHGIGPGIAHAGRRADPLDKGAESGRGRIAIQHQLD